MAFVAPLQVYDRAVRRGLRERGVVNRLSWADMVVAQPGEKCDANNGIGEKKSGTQQY